MSWSVMPVKEVIGKDREEIIAVVVDALAQRAVELRPRSRRRCRLSLSGVMLGLKKVPNGVASARPPAKRRAAVLLVGVAARAVGGGEEIGAARDRSAGRRRVGRATDERALRRARAAASARTTIGRSARSRSASRDRSRGRRRSRPCRSRRAASPTAFWSPLWIAALSFSSSPWSADRDHLELVPVGPDLGLGRWSCPGNRRRWCRPGTGRRSSARARADRRPPSSAFC